MFTFDGKDAADQGRPWSTGASAPIAYLIVGKVLDRVIRP